jgi:hypothetical protein
MLDHSSTEKEKKSRVKEISGIQTIGLIYLAGAPALALSWAILSGLGGAPTTAPFFLL